MSIAPTKTGYRPEDLLTMPDGDMYELVDGDLVERHMGMKASTVAGEIFARLREFVLQTASGMAFPEGTGFQCFENANKVRKPDASFIKANRLRPEDIPDNFCRLHPDLVVEIVSPNDDFYDVEAKRDEFLEAGVSLVWIVSPATQTVTVFRRDGTSTLLRENDDLGGEDVLPGFRCKVGDFFKTPLGALPPTKVAE